MTSRSGAAALVRELSFCGTDGARATRSSPAARFRFALDFDSAQAWPDLPYDPASPASHYAPQSRPALQAVLDAASATLATRVPRAWRFIDGQLERTLLRRSDRMGAAASASNRACVGLCVFTNLDRAPDAVQVAIEGLLHESIHQHLYRTELADGTFCDLAPTPTLRSPWSGSRLPLHSLVHASFVWYGLLTLWSELAQASGSEQESARSRERVAHCLFGFAFLGDVLDGPAFPRAAVDPAVLDCMRALAAAAARAAQAADAGAGLRELPAVRRQAGWAAGLASALARVPG